MSSVFKNIFFYFILIASLFSCSSKKETGESPAKDSLQVTDPLSILDEKIKADPKNADLYLQRSKWNLSMKHQTAAERDIKQALAIDSSKGAYYLQYADISFASLNVTQAEEFFKKAIDLEPKNVDAYLKLSELYLYQKRYVESLKNADEALKIDKHQAKAYFIKGFAFKENRDTAKAISSFQTCVEQEPNYYNAFIQLGNLLSAQRNKLAVQYYNNALKLQPHSTEAYYDRGLFFQNTGEIDKAVSDYNELIKIDPGYAEAYYNLGYIEVGFRNDYQKAIEYFSQAISRKKYYAEAFYNRGYCYEKLGDKQKAIKDYREALAIFPTYKLAKEGLRRIGK